MTEVKIKRMEKPNSGFHLSSNQNLSSAQKKKNAHLSAIQVETMPSSASSTSRSEPKSKKKHDVFISFMREDTRLTFTSHLYAALNRASLQTFLADQNLHTGEDISPSLIQTIKDSRVSLIVFSQNYASSKRCLDELVHVMQYSKEEAHSVIPIFYNVDASGVRNQRGPYEEAFEELERRHGHENVTRWKAALIEAANLSGKHCIPNVTDESNLIDEIVSDVNAKLKHMYECKCSSKGLFGIDEMIEPIEVLLQKSHKVGIWGMGGLGKTTMAKELFGRLSSKYSSRCFFKNVRKTIQRNGLQHARNYLVSELLRVDISSGRLRNSKYVTRMLQTKKALVVLDDVNDSFQLMDLQENILNHLADGSKVIVTTREQQLLKAKGYELHEAKLLSYDNARQRFISKAFGQGDTKGGYEQLIEKFVDYTKHLPLALNVLGSCVHSKDKKLWNDILKKLRDESLNEVVRKALRVSYDGLDNEEKKLFLDIACFLKGESEEFVKDLFKSYRFHSTSGVETLKDKALITVTTSGEVEMHDLIEEMGHQIVREENIDEPGKRTRLWDPNEICDVLKRCEGENVEGIMMNFQSIKHLKLAANAFNNMKKLRFLKIYSPYLWGGSKEQFIVPTTGLQSISREITYFHWEKYPGKSLPSNFCAKHLLELNLSYSQVERLWKGVKDLPNLRRLKLQWCVMLRELPDFSKACRLESIHLTYCKSLREVPESLLCHNSLISLDVGCCSSLESLQSGIHLKSLKHVDANGCTMLKEFSLSSEELMSLNLCGTRIEELRRSMRHCSKLTTLKLPLVLNLKDLLKEVLSCLTSLENLEIDNFDRKTGDIEGMHELFDHLHSLKSLCLFRLLDLKELPDMRHLSNLQLLSLKWCYRLQSLPELPPSVRTLDAYECKLLERASISSTPENCGDKLFSFMNCEKLDVESIGEQAMTVLRNAVQEKGNVTIIYTGKKVPKWFGDNRTQHDGLDTVQLSLSSSHNLLGFVFCVTFGRDASLGFDLFVTDEGGEDGFHIPATSCFIPGNVYLISRPGLSESILEKIEGRRSPGATTYNPIISFKFVSWNGTIRGSGVFPIYASQSSHFKVYSRKRKTIQ